MSPRAGVDPEDVPPLERWRVIERDDMEERPWDKEDLEADLELAAEHESPNLQVLGAALNSARHGPAMAEAITNVVVHNKQTAPVRRLWFLYEWITGRQIEGVDDVPPIPPAPLVDVLDENRFYTSLGVISERHRVRDNLLGCPDFCPMVRRSKELQNYASKNYASQAWFLLNRFTTDLKRDDSVATALKESVFSKHEQYDVERLVSLMVEQGNLADVPLDEHTLQTHILPVLLGVSRTGMSPTYRTKQVYVSETVCTVDDTKDNITFITAKTEDVKGLMRGLFHTMERMERDRAKYPDHVDCVAATAMLGFGLVFIHPFDDGNGRTHRFLIQEILRRLGYVPDMIFPVSNTMVRQRGQYEECLEMFDAEVMSLIQYTVDADGTLTVTNDTAHLYRYFDATPMVEYTYDCVRACIEEVLPQIPKDEAIYGNFCI